MAMLKERIVELRKKNKLSQEQFAKDFGVGRSTVAMWETGDRTPDAETIQRLADFFDTSTDYLLGRTDVNYSVEQFQSTRRGFGRDHGNKATKKYLDLQIFNSLKGLPENVCKELQSPLLFYKVLQLRNDVPVTISESYIPSSLPLKRLKKILDEVKQNPTLSLYKTLESMGRKPINCEETITIDKPSIEEKEILQMPDDVPVARIVRKTFDSSSHLVEYCLLTSRTDLYNFTYRFTL
ncbi:DNA-binding transcriptional regulator, GntR family [Thermoactinomyces sp. DSM 45891]|uniref:helix-turn-helix domain-containing protein n=1 Tax=Thermoactinomyces sp. DSM 45891 TaxID=1761907 RepID=UPI00091384D2|nr:helix-turn-helix domain-containing protein [Thermoactinomyces sp. DSM 45891]SFX52694.1 DNA-binding transcriptional regulator, GntR family [Thermoactinomyces sp. DSM 45891]